MPGRRRPLPVIHKRAVLTSSFGFINGLALTVPGRFPCLEEYRAKQPKG